MKNFMTGFFVLVLLVIFFFGPPILISTVFSLSFSKVSGYYLTGIIVVMIVYFVGKIFNNERDDNE